MGVDGRAGQAEQAEQQAEQLSIPSVPASIAAVRRFAVDACERSGLSELCDTVALLVSEVATNALVHGHGQVRVQVEHHGSVLRVEVDDDNPTLPAVRRATAFEEGGRGLALVDALASSWGSEPTGAGKRVWFEVAA